MNFLDTNVLLYASGFSGANDPRAANAMALLPDASYSIQAFAEFAARATRGPNPWQWERVDALIAEFTNLSRLVVSITPEIAESARRIARDHRVAYYDAQMIAAAASISAARLYTEDMNHGERIAGVEIINPFL